MSTRSNIAIIKGKKRVQIYHHYDGYPEGVGAELSEFIKKIKNNPDEADCLDYPAELAIYLNSEDESYELEGKSISFHGDIEYAYIIDLEKKTITCVKVYAWRMEQNPNWGEEIVNGTFTPTENCKQVYVQGFDEDFPYKEEDE